MQLVPNFFVTDQGLEFLNNDVKRVMKNYNIHHYTMAGTKKNSIVERLNRTLKEMIARYFTEMTEHKKKKRWICVWKEKQNFEY